MLFQRVTGISYVRIRDITDSPSDACFRNDLTGICARILVFFYYGTCVAMLFATLRGYLRVSR